MPPALLFLALGLALAFTPRGARALSLLALVAALAASAFVRVPQGWLEGAFLACWASTVVSLSGTRLDLLKALPCVLIVLPAAWAVSRYASIPVKVVSSWIIAVAILAATLQLLPVTPGYLPDHME